MKLKIIIIFILVFTIISISNICMAKYVFEYNQKVFEVDIDRTSPIINIEYSNTSITNLPVEVKITSNEEIKEIEGWTLLENNTVIVKSYDNNLNEDIIIQDINGNSTNVNVNINNIDKKAPEVEILEQLNTNIGYENYANSDDEIEIKLKIFDENQLINKMEDIIILIDNKEIDCLKEIEIIGKNENYIIYKVKISNVDGNGQLQLKIPNNNFEDIAGNKMTEKVLELGIEIDNIQPKIEYSQELLENGKVIAKIVGNEKIRPINDWQIEENQMIISKEFVSNISYQREVYDFAGNVSVVEIKIEDANYLGFEYIAHISEKGWMKAEDNISGIIKDNNIYKIESLAFRTGENISNDFLMISAFVYTYWGEETFGKSTETDNIYSYGYNPIIGYKTMQNSNLVDIENKKYIQIGGEGINREWITDINGNNPIPVEVSSQYKYGISGIKLNLKDCTENSIIYQIFLNDTGWMQTCKNGEEAMKSFDKPIQAIRIAIVPTSELEIIINEWNKDIGTYNIE